MIKINNEKVKILRIDLENVYYSFSNEVITNSKFYEIIKTMANILKQDKNIYVDVTFEEYAIISKELEKFKCNIYFNNIIDYTKKTTFQIVKNKDVYDNFFISKDILEKELVRLNYKLHDGRHTKTELLHIKINTLKEIIKLNKWKLFNNELGIDMCAKDIVFLISEWSLPLGMAPILINEKTNCLVDNNHLIPQKEKELIIKKFKIKKV